MRSIYIIRITRRQHINCTTNNSLIIDHFTFLNPKTTEYYYTAVNQKILNKQKERVTKFSYVCNYLLISRTNVHVDSNSQQEDTNESKIDNGVNQNG